MSERSFRRARKRAAVKGSGRQHSTGKRIAAASGAALGATVLFAPAAQADVFTVTNLNDAGAGSLRQALLDADAADTGADVVNFQPGLSGTITLTTGEILIADNLYDSVEIRGPGPGVITVSGNNASRIFYSHPEEKQPIVISGLTLTDGNSGTEDGGALYLTEGDFELRNLVITSSVSGDQGGGIFAEETAVEMNNVTVSGNTAQDGGGGIYVNDSAYYGPARLTNVTVSGNTVTDGQGGGILFYNIYSLASVEDSTITGNSVTAATTTQGQGGGIALYESEDEGDIRIVDTVISGNSASGSGGGIAQYQGDFYGSLLIEGSTISGNASGNEGGGAYLYYLSDDANVTIRDTTISGNTAADDGGGISTRYNSAPTRIQRSTISGNNAADQGGGVYLYYSDPSTGSFTFRDSTVANNAAATGGGLFIDDVDAADVSLINTIVADSRSGGDLARSAASTGTFLLDFSLVESPGTGLTEEQTAGSNILGQDPQLGPLGPNGGPTQTHVPGRDGPVIDVGSSPFTVDQRGFTRPFDQPDRVNSGLPGANGSDIGAVELARQPQGFCNGQRATVLLADPGGITQGTAGADVFVGDAAVNTFRGGGGNDLICAGGGADVVFGDEGNDNVIGAEGNDQISGGPGKDNLKGGAGNDTLDGNAGNDTLTGGAGKDKINGSTGNDRGFGQAGNDRLNGAAGNDVLNGGGASDVITGGKGNDTLKGAGGKDRLTGGQGKDKLNGGPGRDKEVKRADA